MSIPGHSVHSPYIKRSPRKTTHTHTLETMTPAWVLPVITLIVTSSGGGVVASSLYKYSLNHALITASLAIFMVSIGLSVALMILTIYLLRLILHGLPPGATITSAFLPLGPTGQAGYAILLLGQFFETVLPLPYGSSKFLIAENTGASINVVCTIISVVLWSLASGWLFFALLGVQNIMRQMRIPFKVETWGLIFPNVSILFSLFSRFLTNVQGVYANLTLSLASTLDSTFFRVWGSIYAVATLILWCFVTTRTLVLIRNKRIFEIPS